MKRKAETTSTGSNKKLQTPEYHTSQLFDLIKRGDQSGLSMALQSPKYNFNATNENGDTPLLLAIKLQKDDMAHTFIKDRQVDIDIQDSLGYTPLMLAIKLELTSVVEKLILQCDATKQNKDGNTAFMLACIEGNEKMIKLLLKKNVDLNIHVNNNNDENALLLAAQKFNDSGTFQSILNLYQDVTMFDKNGQTALMKASEKGNTKIVKLLLDNNVSVDAIDSSGQTALMKASEKGNTKIVKLLLDNNANVNAEDKNSQTALSLAMKQAKAELVDALVEAGADVNNAKAPLGMTITQGYAPLIEIATFFNNEDIVAYCLTKAQDNKVGVLNRVIQLAAENGYLNICKLAVEYCEKYTVTDHEQYQEPAIAAARNGHLDILKYFLETITLPQDDVFASELLAAAAKGNHLAIVKYYLLQERVDHSEDFFNFDPNSSNIIWGNMISELGGSASPLLAAMKHNSYEVFEYLLDFMQDQVLPSYSLKLIKRGGKDISSKLIKLLIEATGALSHKEAEQFFFECLKRAIYNKSDHLIECIKNKYCIDVGKSEDEFNQLLLKQDTKSGSLLHIATQANNLSFIKELIEKEIDVNYQDENGQTPLAIAAEDGHSKIIKKLLKAGANPNIANNEGMTPLMHVITNKMLVDTVALLVEHGANVEAINNKKFTALTYAASSGNRDIIEIIMREHKDINSALLLESLGFASNYKLFKWACKEYELPITPRVIQHLSNGNNSEKIIKFILKKHKDSPDIIISLVDNSIQKLAFSHLKIISQYAKETIFNNLPLLTFVTMHYPNNTLTTTSVITNLLKMGIKLPDDLPDSAYKKIAKIADDYYLNRQIKKIDQNLPLDELTIERFKSLCLTKGVSSVKTSKLPKELEQIVINIKQHILTREAEIIGGLYDYSPSSLTVENKYNNNPTIQSNSTAKMKIYQELYRIRDTKEQTLLEIIPEAWSKVVLDSVKKLGNDFTHNLQYWGHIKKILKMIIHDEQIPKPSKIELNEALDLVSKHLNDPKMLGPYIAHLEQKVEQQQDYITALLNSRQYYPHQSMEHDSSPGQYEIETMGMTGDMTGNY